MTNIDPAEGARVFDLDRSYVFHSWSAQKALKPMCVAGSQGSYFWDYDGNKYLDFASQLVNVNIGHQHPKVIAAIQDQAGKLATVAPQHANDKRGEAAQRIVELAGGKAAKVFFTNGGADGVENAIRMARLHTHKHKILSAYRSYHGNTGSAIQATGDPRRWPNEYSAQQVHFFGPYLYRSEFWATTPEQESERALTHLEHVIQFEGPGTVGAVLLESVIGTAGILVPPPGYLEGVRALCDKYEIVMILDETMSGFGRTGKWFAYQNWNVEPDLVVFAKGSNSGYVPVGGVIISGEIAATFDERVFPGGLTYSGHPLAAASIVGSIDAMKEEKIIENAASIGENVLGPGLRELAEKHPVIGEVRGLGVFWALDLVINRETREPLAPYGGTSQAMTDLVTECKKRGLMPFANFNRMHVVPPCVVTEAEAREGLEILDQAFSAIDSYYQG
ncbi:MAG: aspartate aminotransferase family protein [Candidatus Nanopelagicales bacterium]|jgi:taurine---2-oxoglutarate transaminase|nr:aspartate aminotransferase family protein [Actinomycetota bacterium]MBT5182088.1 aspartate aminotransferase family protein [Actinomycetota bacterium]MBT5501810.1 aspartate aminotransferase family protein [Actinomycetota bacterium]MBT5806850.1 aspartate aminotransferase family protein [Actinomycetota bacterium]MDA9334379.1 aspartate aminotransferase family protein [Actinomycetota bacterium]